MMLNGILNVTAVRHVQGHVLWLQFNDGAEGTVDLANHLDGEVFQPLKDIAFFSLVIVHPDCKTVAWPNGADIAPEYLRERLQPVTRTRA